jgi:hypothetical protein
MIASREFASSRDRGLGDRGTPVVIPTQQVPLRAEREARRGGRWGWGPSAVKKAGGLAQISSSLTQDGARGG